MAIRHGLLTIRTDQFITFIQQVFLFHAVIVWWFFWESNPVQPVMSQQLDLRAKEPYLSGRGFAPRIALFLWKCQHSFSDDSSALQFSVYLFRHRSVQYCSTTRFHPARWAPFFPASIRRFWYRFYHWTDSNHRPPTRLRQALFQLGYNGIYQNIPGSFPPGTHKEERRIWGIMP